MREITGSWLNGPQAALDATSEYPGEKFGAPKTGPGSMAGLVRRALALLVDWFIIYLPTFGVLGWDGRWFLGGAATTTLVLWAVMSMVTVILFAQTPGMGLVGIGVARVDADERVGVWRAIVRTIFAVTIFPVLFQDEDSRGLHDQATGTAVIRTR